MNANEFCNVYTSQTLGGLEMIEAQFTETVFGKHAHAGFVISVVDAGVMHFSHRGESHNALPGELSIVAPDELHTGSKGRGEGWRYRALYPSEERIRALNQSLFGVEQTPYFRQSVITDACLSQQMQTLLHKLAHGAEALDIEVHWETLLVNLLRQSFYQGSEPRFTKAQSNVELVRDWLADRYDQKVSLDYAAELAGISKFHLIKEFKRLYQLTPHQYQIQQRLNHARAQLKRGISAVDVALNCGFHDQSHFSKAFVSTMGISPSAYQQQFFTR
ncbi:hypothetical protein DN730_04625 [Marinomonas piezotolerans]|uniref:HTH araC/xylS-type domain-containing protein n=1 Tax=Marinomonas piezotolerans TaxID=2213058 RepID=A0A370UAT2_9GAMM|nr:AraC family transcriptional regulator [Marinomonas piezotolerans]RDL44907.1 hypothetical protein DN730_04625 [Marinomonas piezotolerans]